jgi:plasmid stability protein
MVQLLVRQLNDKVVDRLKKRAKEHGRSLQSEVKTILKKPCLTMIVRGNELIHFG